jgi:hypothetical protein
MSHVPLLLLVPVFALVAAVQWRARRPLAQILVAVATLFAFYGLWYPGASAQELVDGGRPATAVLVAVGRATGLAAVLAVIALSLRERHADDDA